MVKYYELFGMGKLYGKEGIVIIDNKNYLNGINFDERKIRIKCKNKYVG